MLSIINELIKKADKKDKYINLNNTLYPVKPIKQLLKTFKKSDCILVEQNQVDMTTNKLSLTFTWNNGFLNLRSKYE